MSGKSKKDFDDGNAKFVPYTAIFNNSKLDLNKCGSVKIDDTEKQNKIQQGDVLFTGSSETSEECGMSSVVTQEINEDIYLNSFSFGLRLRGEISLCPDYASHLFRCHAVRKNIQKTASGVTRFNVSKEKMKKITVCIPTLEKQKEIATILNRFDRLCHDIQSGLPAEIEKHQKRYEYYRDKLLSFPEKQ